jgi:hypothetical protein
MFDCITSLHHSGHQPRYIGQDRIEQDEVRRHGHAYPPLPWRFVSGALLSPTAAGGSGSGGGLGGRGFGFGSWAIASSP